MKQIEPHGWHLDGTDHSHEDRSTTWKIWLYDPSEAERGTPRKSERGTAPTIRDPTATAPAEPGTGVDYAKQQHSEAIETPFPRIVGWGGVFGQAAYLRRPPRRGRKGWEGDGLGILRFWKVPWRSGVAGPGVVERWGWGRGGGCWICRRSAAGPRESGCVAIPQLSAANKIHIGKKIINLVLWLASPKIAVNFTGAVHKSYDYVKLLYFLSAFMYL
jgi:hypothetical protein